MCLALSCSAEHTKRLGAIVAADFHIKAAEVIYDFRAIGEALRKQRIDDWSQPKKDEPASPKAAEPAIPDWMLDPFGGWVGGY